MFSYELIKNGQGWTVITALIAIGLLFLAVTKVYEKQQRKSLEPHKKGSTPPQQQKWRR